MSTVYIVQRPWEGREPVDRVRDFSQAKRFGKLVFLLEAQHKIGCDLADKLLAAGLSSFGEHDYLLCSGHPVAIGVATAVIAKRYPRIKMLVWSNRAADYSVIRVDVPAPVELTHV